MHVVGGGVVRVLEGGRCLLCDRNPFRRGFDDSRSLQRAVPVHAQFRAQRARRRHARSPGREAGARRPRVQRRQRAEQQRRINPFALEALANAGIDTSGFRSKSWDEFAAAGAPEMRIVVTVCDSAAKETCPYWPGSPVKVHWGYPDPSNAPGGDEGKRIAFELTRQAIGYRMLQLLQLPIESMDDAALQRALVDLYRS
jgi:arsenate reductase